MTETVYIVRHGQRQDSVDPDWESHADRVHDPGLTDHGKWEAWRVGRRFADAGHQFAGIYASPFFRTVQTADEICRELEAPFRLEAGLGEHLNPDWFDRDPERLPPETLAEWFSPLRLDHDSLVTPQFPETGLEAEKRAGRAARALVAAHDGDGEGPLLFVGHGLTVGGVTRGLVGTTDGVDAPLCGVTKISRSDGDDWTLEWSGDVSHLSP